MTAMRWVASMAVAAFLGGVGVAQADDHHEAKEEVKLQTVAVGGNVHMIMGPGGNVGVFVGEDGVFLIDDQLAPLTDKVQAEIAKLSDKPVKFVINTHWHFDHTGGNEHFGKAGAVIVAHDNVRKRMTSEQFIKALGQKQAPASARALPVVTFTDQVTFHWNGDTVHVMHVQKSHTDSDAIVYFEKANVLHAGDTFLNGMYPLADLGNGGTLRGLIAVADQMLKKTNATTKIIPGHGALASRADLQANRNMMVAVKKRVTQLIASGKKRKAVIAAKPTKKFDAKFNNGPDFVKADAFVGRLYDELRKRKKSAKR